MAFIWNIGIAPGNVKPRTGQVIRRTASLRNKSDDVEAEKGLSRMRVIRSGEKNTYQVGRYAMICAVNMASCRLPFHALMLGREEKQSQALFPR